jgi:hypothetical protein
MSRDEYMALSEIANHELRDPRVQARLILRKALFGAPAELPTVIGNANDTTQLTLLPTGIMPEQISNSVQFNTTNERQ